MALCIVLGRHFQQEISSFVYQVEPGPGPHFDKYNVFSRFVPQIQNGLKAIFDVWQFEQRVRRYDKIKLQLGTQTRGASKSAVYTVIKQNVTVKFLLRLVTPVRIAGKKDLWARFSRRFDYPLATEVSPSRS